MNDGGPTVVVFADEVADIDTERWGRLATAALVDEGVSGPAELTLSFVAAETIAGLNEAHLGGTGPTDVLAFPIDGLDPLPDRGGPRLLGDVVVSPDIAEHNATAHNRSVDDEVALLVVHGVLHVLGHDHAEPVETERMRARERVLLARHHPSP